MSSSKAAYKEFSDLAVEHQPLPTISELPELVIYLLRLGDDHMVTAQRLGELVAWMPDLEEDIAVANLSLDHIGGARLLYTYAGTHDPAKRDEDAFAMARSEREYLNATLVEQPNGDFADTIVRLFFLDVYQQQLYAQLSNSSDAELAAIAKKLHKEARYHVDYSTLWMQRLGDGTTESFDRTQEAIDNLWRFTDDLFYNDALVQRLVEAGIAADPIALHAGFQQQVDAVLFETGLSLPQDKYQRTGGRTGFHTSHLGHLLTEMQWLYRSNPGASW